MVEKVRANLQAVPSLTSPSSSSDPARLAALEVVREVATEELREDTRDFAFLDTVLPLSNACLRRSCISKYLPADVEGKILSSIWWFCVCTKLSADLRGGDINIFELIKGFDDNMINCAGLLSRFVI